MRLTSTTLALVSLVGLVPALIAGCGSDDGDTESSSTTTTTSSGMTTTSSGVGGDMSSSSSSSSTSSGMGGMGMGGMGGMGAGGMGGMGGMGGATSDAAAYVWGDWDTDNTDDVGIISYPAGTAQKLALMGVTAINDIDGVVASPDGTKMAIALEADGNPVQILVYNADGSGAPTVVAAASAATVGVADMAWSPDGTQIAFIADWNINANGHNIVFVANADGSSNAPKLVSQETMDSAQDAYSVSWVNNTTVAYHGDLVDNGEDNLYTSDVTLTVPAPVPLVPEAMTLDGSEVRSGAQVDAGGKIYFRSSHLGGAFYLFRADVDGQNLEQVAASAALTNGNGQAEVGDFAISPDGTQIAFSADAPNAELYQVYVATDVGMAASTLQSNVQAAAVVGEFRGPVGEGTIVWSPDQTTLAVIADWQVNAMGIDNDQSAFIVPASGAAGGVRILAASANSGNPDVNSILFSSDGSRIFARGDLVVGNETEVHSTADFVTADQEATTVVVDVPSGGDVAGISLKP